LETSDPNRIARIVYRTGCLQFGSFVLTSGLRSPYYVDLSNLYVKTNEYREVVKALANTISREHQERLSVVGVALRGLPFAVSVANVLRVPFHILRKEAKTHGTSKILEGTIDKSSRVVIVDDVATTGGSLFRGVQVLLEMGVKVDTAFVVLDRLQGAGQRLRELGVELKSLIDILKSIDALAMSSLVPRDLAETIRDHVKRNTYV
jgi:orotate phosphoribosyltransferase